eukprot:2005921-Pyramimonas_sp.AAC.1
MGLAPSVGHCLLDPLAPLPGPLCAERPPSSDCEKRPASSPQRRSCATSALNNSSVAGLQPSQSRCSRSW